MRVRGRWRDCLARLARAAARPPLWAFLLLGAPLLAQTAESAAAAPLKLKSESRLVLVDAVVSARKDVLVQGLAAGDFHVFEDGKEQVITAFQPHNGGGAPQQHILLLFDGQTSDDLKLLQQPASRFIAANAGPGRLMSIALYSSGCMTFAAQFTADVGQLQRALGALPGMLRCGFISDPFGDMQARYYAQLAKDLAHVPGHKVVALFVSGAPVLKGGGRTVTAAAESAPRNIDPAVGSPADPGTSGGFGPGAFEQPVTPSTDQMVAQAARSTGRDPYGMEAEFRKADVSVYPLETQAGARTPGWALHLADATGGHRLYHGNDVAGVFDLLAAEQDQAYTLGYVPQDSPEGSCHPLKVTVGRPDARVRGRNLYCNVHTVSLAAANPREKALEGLVASPPAVTAAASLSLPFFYEPNGVARVNLALEIPPLALHAAEANGKLHAELDVLGLAFNLGDEVAARFSDTLTFDFAGRRQFDDFLQQEIHYERQFKIAPGNYRFKLIYRSAESRAVAVEAPLAIGPFDPHRLMLSAVALSRSEQPISPEAVQEEIEQGKKPLVFRGARIAVSGSSWMPRTGAAEAYCEINRPSTGGPPLRLTMRLRVLDAQTAQARWASADIDLSAMAAAANVIPVALKLPVDALPPGTYQAEFTVRDSTGAQAARTTQFRLE